MYVLAAHAQGCAATICRMCTSTTMRQCAVTMIDAAVTYSLGYDR